MLENGKMPPHHIDIEKVILGALIFNSQSFYDVQEFFFPELFYKEEHVHVAEAIINLRNQNKAVDMLSIVAWLKSKGVLELVGGAYYVSSLTNGVFGASGNLAEKVLLLNEAWIKREMIRHSSLIIKEAYEDGADAFDVIAATESALNDVLKRVMVSKTADAMACQFELLNHIAKIEATQGEVIGVPTGFIEVNKITGGWQKSDLIILAARPGMGKTSLALNFCQSALNSQMPVLVFSLEMSKMQLYARMCSQATSIPLEKFLKKTMDEGEKAVFRKESGTLANMPLYIDDRGGVDIQYIKTKARKEKRDKKIELIVIDYLQLIAVKENKKSTNDQIAEISKGLKNLAKELDIPVICLSQLSRDVEKRPDKRPQLSDLRDSGAIEQDADMVMFIYRPEYYGIMDDGAGTSTVGMAELIGAKHRNGAIFNEWMGFVGRCTNFYDKTAPIWYPPTTQDLTPLETNSGFLNG